MMAQKVHSGGDVSWPGVDIRRQKTDVIHSVWRSYQPAAITRRDDKKRSTTRWNALNTTFDERTAATHTTEENCTTSHHY